MAIFGVLDFDPVVQVNDKIRLKAIRSFVSKDEAAITLVEIEPVAGNGFIDVTDADPNELFLDWSYATDGTAVVSLRITTDGAPVTVTKNLTVVTEADDMLFSTDSDLLKYETEIMDLLPDGYSSFNHQHRKSQQTILDWLTEEGYRASGNTKITKDLILDNDEVRKWSEALTLKFVYNDNSNSVDDKFKEKSNDYNSVAIDARTRSTFYFDKNKDGEITDGEFIRPTSLDMIRR